ncbi:DNA polymerase epsilon subunit B [Dictyocaulus viviparus]|uniref:DNA polymerase alpha subunit B n=1 Tax=Dictyocaulus viviparus TaxID=29172 RepID=A0A0D8Y2Q1_DICVI|nr:DNA polymerase epsilon subunit B [Dictyocaulus viviparus]
MVYMDYDTIFGSLSDFGYSMPERDDLINKVNSIATQFNLDLEDFVDELLASAVNMKKSEIDLGVLEHMEAELSRKLGDNVHKMSTLSSKKSKRSEPAFGQRTADQCGFDASCIEVETTIHEDFGFTHITGKYREFSPIMNVVLRKVEGKLFANYSVVLGSVSITILSSIPEDTYANDKISNVIDAKCGRMTNFGARCRQANPEISNWSVPVSGSTGCEYVYGEIVKEISEDILLSDQSVSLLVDNELGSVIKLDLTRLPEITIFPGQMVALFGSFENGDRFVASLQLFPSPLPLSPLGRSANDGNLRLWCACGPFTSTENCSYEPLCDLLDMVKQQQPHVLVLMGPFVDRKNNFLKNSHFSVEYEDLMGRLMKSIARSLDGCRTELIVLPASSHDACCNYSFPTSPFVINSDIYKKLGRAKCDLVTELCVHPQIMAHLSKNEWHRSVDKENRDRIARLASHILEQGSLYPLFPSSLPTSIEECEKVCTLRNAPHMIICSSVLPTFIKIVDRTVVANPGTLVRGVGGTFLRCEFATSYLADGTANLADCSKYEIIQL